MPRHVYEVSEALEAGSVDSALAFAESVVQIPGGIVSAWVDCRILDAAQPADIPRFGGPPDAQARITRVGHLELGQPIGDGWGRVFDSCPTRWDGIWPDPPSIEFTVRTQYALATATLHVSGYELTINPETGVLQIGRTMGKQAQT